MHKIFTLFIFLSLTVVLAGQQLVPYFPIKTSYLSLIKVYDIEFNATLSPAKANYWYQVNNGPYSNVDSVIVQHGKTTVRIQDLSLKPDTNMLYLFYKDVNNIRIFSQKVFFVNPVLTVKSVIQGTTPLKKEQSVYIMTKTDEVSVSYSAEFPKISDPEPFYTQGSKNLTRIRYRLNNGNYLFSGLSGDLKINNFLAGSNQLLITYESEASAKDQIVYRTDTLNFFMLNFDLPVSVWKKDTLIKLSGTPSGGWYTGTGIVGNSSYFNPNLVNDSTSITYNFPFKGILVTYTRGIKVLSYDFSITGPLSVCLNSTAIYKINQPRQDFSYKWAVDLGKSTLGTNNETNIIRWNRTIPTGVNFGTVIVTATHKTSGAVFTRSIMVNQKKNIAYDPPELFFGDKNKKLIICTKKDAYQYNWYADDSPQGATTQPYFNFSVPGQKYAAELMTEEGCVTRIEIPVSSTSGYSGQVVPIANGKGLDSFDSEKSFLLFPNPVYRELNILFPPLKDNIVVRIFDSASRTVFETTVGKEESLKSIDVTELQSGRYIVLLMMPEGSRSMQFVKIKQQ
jgi:hypothetical protein